MATIDKLHTDTILTIGNARETVARLNADTDEDWRYVVVPIDTTKAKIAVYSPVFFEGYL